MEIKVKVLQEPRRPPVDVGSLDGFGDMKSVLKRVTCKTDHKRVPKESRPDKPV